MSKVIKTVSLNTIKIPKDYPRYLVDPKKATKEFSKNIIYPVVVDQDNYLLDGYRRIIELRGRGKKQVKVIVRNVSKNKRLETSLILSMQRKDLNAMEKAKAFDNLMKSYRPNLSIREVGRRLRINKATVLKHLKLLKLPKEVQRKVERGELKIDNINKLRYMKKGKIKTMKEFNLRTSDLQYSTLLLRLNAFEKYLNMSTLDEKQLRSLSKRVRAIRWMIEGRLKNKK